MTEIAITADALVSALLRLSESEPVYILDSCGVRHLGSHLLIAGIRPVELFEMSGDEPDRTLEALEAKLTNDLAAIFTLSYDFGLKLQQIGCKATPADMVEPDLFLARFDVLIVHDYDSRKSFLTGNESRFDEIASLICDERSNVSNAELQKTAVGSVVRSNFTRAEYLAAVDQIREFIRSGNTYQTNLTQRLECNLSSGLTPEEIFSRVRHDHPSPFAAFLRRPTSTVISASPERFFHVKRDGRIESSPIKGTRPRGRTADEDARLRYELLSSTKDRAENTMIVDLVRNDLGRVCEFGSVKVEKMCDVEEHPTLFHLVSTVRGKLRPQTSFSEILRAVFPCGSITGAPKIRTMQIIDEIEPDSRGLSMGAIGCYLPESFGEISDSIFDLSVAIRTMVVRDEHILFNVGGGVVIDSDPAKEYDESLLKAAALLRAIGADVDDLS